MSQTNRSKKHQPVGFGQLSMVEHSLCPLDRQSSLVANLVHEAQYQYSDARRKRRTARARVFCPLGLSASDELYLWGLLALTLSQSDDRYELVATPHWCLRQLGIVDSRSGRGGEQYRLFRDALRRLSVTSYLCDAFYDPVRAEHRDVSFHFFSYDLPTDPSSQRAWRLNWDRTFFDLAKHGASHLRFDLELYRKLDPASRRLFLFVSKIFHRRSTLPQFELRHVAVDVLGFSSDVALRDLRMKVIRCLKKLDANGVTSGSTVTRVAKNRYVVNAGRGAYFDRKATPDADYQEKQPVLETLVHLGFDIGAAHSLLRRYPVRLLEEWCDITQAASERFGRKFFKKSPMAFLVDSVSKAHRGRRTAPDWWHEVRRTEQKTTKLSDESQKLFATIRSEVFGQSGKGTTGSKDAGLETAADILKTV
ncbi:hypothetical protein [Rhodopirellula bahusiensis]|uniref:hypothetical protein n=1 Tax=Rhodopirellula bahusiensis TaxID=2014065 RepID=UPI0032637BAF